jgi:hypothetical protein
MFCTNRRETAGREPWRVAAAGVLALAMFVASGADAFAQQQDSILKQAFKVLGFATDVGPPVDFVTKTRPGSDPGYIPAFQPPPEPARPKLKSDELKAVQSDLDGVGKQHDALRQAFPPAAKAMAEEQAAKKKPNSKVPAAQQ